MEELKALVARAQADDLDAYGEIVRRFQDMAYGYAYSILGDFHLAEDAAQEAFVEAYRDLSKLADPAAFPGWFRRIVQCRCSRLTRGKRVPIVPLEAAAEIASAEAQPAQAAEDREMKDKVLAAIRSLPEQQREVMTLFYINGYSQDDIAEFLEVPAGTVKSRLAASRNRLKERMLNMVEETLKDNALPEDFADRLLMFPFPHIEPEVRIVDVDGEKMTVRCTDAGSSFVPLAEHGACDWCFYNRPEGRLTGVYEYRVIGASQRGEHTVLRLWNRFTDLQRQGAQEWKENHIVLEGDTWRWVRVQRQQPGKLVLSDYKFPGDPEHCSCLPQPMQLAVGTKWADGDGKGEVVGVSKVTIGKRSWRCLKVVYPAQYDKINDGAPAVLAEWYVAKQGRTVFFRRYNGPGYTTPEKPTSFESLEGNIEVRFEGKCFRHAYDCITDIALEKAFN